MKGIYLTSYGEAFNSFETRELKAPEPKGDQVLIKVVCFGLNYAEVMARKGLYRDAPKLPFIPGYDCVGYIEKVGPDGDKNLVGKRVLALVKFGSYAQYVTASPNMISEMPSSMTDAEGTAIGVQYLTAYYMSHIETNIFSGDKILIRSASGGVGTALSQLCRHKNAEIYSLTGSEIKKQELIKRGDDHVFNYNDLNDLEKFNQGKEKFDVVFNPVAGKTFKSDFKRLNAGGSLILFGTASRTTKSKGFFQDIRMLFQMGMVIPIFLVGKSVAIHGVNILRIAESKPNIIRECMKEILNLYSAGVVKPFIANEFKAEEIAKAHDLLESGKSRGKIVLYW